VDDTEWVDNDDKGKNEEDQDDKDATKKEKEKVDMTNAYNQKNTISLSKPLKTALLSSDNPYCEYPLKKGDLSMNGATPWYCTIAIGTPAQPLKFMIDTGTKNTWVTSSTCTTDACLVHTGFNPKKSSSLNSLNFPPNKVDFGPWGEMEVDYVLDISHLDLGSEKRLDQRPLTELCTEPISIMLATNYSGEQFKYLVADGGMAIPSVPDREATALPYALKNGGKTKFEVCSFYTDPVMGTGVCRMGALDINRFDENTVQWIETKPNSDFSYLWCVELDEFTCNGSVVDIGTGKGFNLALDTGSSFFKGSKDVIAKITNAIEGSGLQRLSRVLYSKEDLHKYPTLKLNIAGTNYELTPEQYFFKVGNRWELGFQVMNGLPPDMLLAGSIFLDTVYCAFIREEEGAVLLAQPKSTSQSFNIGGTNWINSYDSKLYIGPIAEDGTFSGNYSSTTGATGDYPVVGVADPSPIGDTQTISFSVSWKSRVGRYDPSWHDVSSFTGLVKLNQTGKPCLKLNHLFQQSIQKSVTDYTATALSTGGDFTFVSRSK